MVRNQLSMFVRGPKQHEIEQIRQAVDPVQSALIPAHVTVCREDELQGVSVSMLRARLAAQVPITLTFGEAERFGVHGIMLKCVDGAERHAQLRQRVLGQSARVAMPHITLAHPRNPMARGNSLDKVGLALPIMMEFDRIVLIHQDAANEPWHVLEEFLFCVLPDASAEQPTGIKP